MSGTKGATPAPLDDLMLAMDVVDTLRHQQTLVQRELNSEERDQALIHRLREIYAGQGIDVPDKVLAEGVSALKEDRFTYRPVGSGLGRFLAGMYVRRGAWAKGILSTVVLLGVIGGAYWGFVVWPESQQQQQVQRELQSQGDRIAALRDALDVDTSSWPKDLQGTLTTKRDQALNALTTAESLHSNPGDDLAQQQTTRQSLDESLSTADRLVQDIGALLTLSRDLPQKQQAVLRVSSDPLADTRANEIYNTGVSAMQLGDVAASRRAAADLDALLTQVGLSYELRIVSREGLRTGVWRQPPNNRNARNYYIIVQALDPTGRAVEVAVNDEELGQTKMASMFGLRVDKSVYDRVAADKQDDGIVQNTRFGQKRAGQLNPDFVIPSTGAGITRW